MRYNVHKNDAQRKTEATEVGVLMVLSDPMIDCTDSGYVKSVE